MFENVREMTIDGKRVAQITFDGRIVWAALPEGYTRIDYIGTTGSGSGSSGSGQYIGTGVVLNQDSRVVCEVMAQGIGTSQGNIYGARASGSSRVFAGRAMSGGWQIGYGSGYNTGSVPVDTTKWSIIDHNKNVLYVDGVLAFEREYVTFETPYPALIGATRAASVYYGSAYFRNFKIYQADVLVRDFLPCLNPDGKPGMYDLVEGKFYGNDGSGEFSLDINEASMAGTFALARNDEYDDEGTGEFVVGEVVS